MRLWIAPTAFLALATVSGCEAPVSYTGLPMTPYDRNTAFRVDDTPSGFTLFVRQSRYQYILNDAIQTSCTQAIKSLAQEIAERRGHKVEIMSRYNNGAAPVMIRLMPGGIIEAGADPFYGRSARAR